MVINGHKRPNGVAFDVEKDCGGKFVSFLMGSTLNYFLLHLRSDKI
jgi:hypothetical protein